MPPSQSEYPSENGASWRVQRMVIDPDGHNDWVMELDVDLAASREAGAPVRKLLHVGVLG